MTGAMDPVASTRTEAFLATSVGRFVCAWPVHLVRHVRLPMPLLNDAALPPFVDGALRIRRTLVPVLDLRRRWHQALEDRTTERIVLAVVEGFVLGIVVDRELGVFSARTSARPADVELPPGLPASESRAVIEIAPVAGASVLQAVVIEPAELLSADERAKLWASPEEPLS